MSHGISFRLDASRRERQQLMAFNAMELQQS
jgi:hypothetical protein